MRASLFEGTAQQHCTLAAKLDGFGRAASWWLAHLCITTPSRAYSRPSAFSRVREPKPPAAQQAKPQTPLSAPAP
jgi:hypothetical protein